MSDKEQQPTTTEQEQTSTTEQEQTPTTEQDQTPKEAQVQTLRDEKEITPIEESYPRISLAHQEVERVLAEIDAYWRVVEESGGEWVMLEGMANLLANDLGYEDQDEFEEAMNGSLANFLSQFPHIEISVQESTGKPVFRVLPKPSEDQLRPFKLICHVKSRRDLWRVCFKAEQARIEIPELEFEIGASAKPQIDCIYNHIAQAVFNLGTVVRESRSYSDEGKKRISETIEMLNVLLDVEQPWTFVVHDVSGLSGFKPSDGIEVEYLDLVDVD
eukprot:c9582_g1_i3.p1 GENE.c9582_g1_i3~~c9582_g1_i3.p1  ORF type:complete len:287 (-),score=68.60 c9582_g1_i3:973-1791(-)